MLLKKINLLEQYRYKCKRQNNEKLINDIILKQFESMNAENKVTMKIFILFLLELS